MLPLVWLPDGLRWLLGAAPEGSGGRPPRTGDVMGDAALLGSNKAFNAACWEGNPAMFVDIIYI